ncbi:MAG: hypothetical protein AAFU61_17000 [Pseudomonadota bacterium]
MDFADQTPDAPNAAQTPDAPKAAQSDGPAEAAGRDAPPKADEAEAGAEATPAPAALDPARPLEGRSLLIVEDDALLALDLEELVRGLGASDVCVCDRAEAALERIDASPPDLSLLDHRLSEGTSLPVAERLSALRLPFAVTSGAGGKALPDLLAQAPSLAKPASSARVRAVARRLLGPAV